MNGHKQNPMRKIFLLFAIITLFAIRAQSQQNVAKVGYANVAYIMSQMPELQQMETELKATQAKLQSQFEVKSQEFQKQFTDYTANLKTMPDTTRENVERRLQSAKADLDRFEQDAQVTIENTQKLRMAPLYLKVGSTIQQVAEENGFSIILNKQIGGIDFLVFVDDKMDISNMVLNKLGVTPNLPAGNSSPSKDKPRQ